MPTPPASPAPAPASAHQPAPARPTNPQPLRVILAQNPPPTDPADLPQWALDQQRILAETLDDHLEEVHSKVEQTRERQVSPVVVIGGIVLTAIVCGIACVILLFTEKNLKQTSGLTADVTATKEAAVAAKTAAEATKTEAEKANAAIAANTTAMTTTATKLGEVVTAVNSVQTNTNELAKAAKTALETALPAITTASSKVQTMVDAALPVINAAGAKVQAAPDANASAAATKASYDAILAKIDTIGKSAPQGTQAAVNAAALQQIAQVLQGNTGSGVQTPDPNSPTPLPTIPQANLAGATGSASVNMGAASTRGNSRFEQLQRGVESKPIRHPARYQAGWIDVKYSGKLLVRNYIRGKDRPLEEIVYPGQGYRVYTDTHELTFEPLDGPAVVTVREK